MQQGGSAGGPGVEVLSSGETVFPNIWLQIEGVSCFSLGRVAREK